MIFPALGLAAATALSAQDTIVVSGEVSCDECRITWDTVATIGGIDGPGLDVLSDVSSVAVDRSGRIFVAVYMIPEISVFDPAGTFEQTVGRGGQGPGEYFAIAHIDAGPQYIHVRDYNGRTMLDYNFEVVRADRISLPFLYTYTTESDDIVFAGDLPTESSVGHRLHILRPTGEIESFGGRDVVYQGPRSSRPSPPITGNAEVAWVLEARVNQISRWDLAPEPTEQKVFIRQVEEFDRHDPSLFPKSLNRGAMLDESGLWVIWEAPDPEWKDRTGPDEDRPDAPKRKIVDSYLDLIDPETGRTLSRVRFDGATVGFAHGSRYLVAYHETDAGVPYIHLLDPQVTGVSR